MLLLPICEPHENISAMAFCFTILYSIILLKENDTLLRSDAAIVTIVNQGQKVL